MTDNLMSDWDHAINAAMRIGRERMKYWTKINARGEADAVEQLTQMIGGLRNNKDDTPCH